MMAVFSNLAVIATLALSSPAVATPRSPYGTGYPPCDALITAGLGNRVLLPSDASYEPRIQSYWALNTHKHPYCLIQPHTAQEVSTALTTLLGTGNGNTSNQVDSVGDWHIAVRAGGHNLGDSNNIDNGVTIDLKYLNGTSYNQKTNIASIGPGAKWEDVYASLHKYGVVATGGRDGDVGVGGFLLGGGSTYYMAKEGFGCDAIANFEVVLVNGTIVNANKKENDDLWRALKGGGSNFGVVTRYDMEALPDKKLARGQRTMNAKYTGQFVDAVVDFTDKQQQYDSDALIAILGHVEGEDILATIEVNTEGVENSTGFDKFRKIPQTKPFEQNVAHLDEAARNSTLPGGSWALQTTLTFKNDAKMLNHAASAHSKFAADVEKSIGKKTFYSIIFFQPLPSFFADISEKRGGNMFTDTLRDGNAVLWTAGLFVYTNQSDFAVASARMHEMVAELEQYSQSIGADNQLKYLNYADFSQDPLGSYPEESVEHMRKVAVKYDPEGKFQTRIPGGFKISRVH